MLNKWDVLLVWCANLPQAHNKYCICIDPAQHWFFFINSSPPYARRAREVAITVAVHEAPFLTHQSYIDTTSIERLHADEVTAALAEADRRKGRISPTLVNRIKATVQGHGALNADEMSAVLND
jgi:hypothetical protein